MFELDLHSKPYGPTKDGHHGIHAELDQGRCKEASTPGCEHDLRLILDSIPGHVAILSGSGDLELVNKNTLDYFHKSLDELKGWTSSDAVHPDDLPHVTAAWARSMRSGDLLESEHRLRRADGVYRWFQLRALPWRDSANRIARWHCLITDIHDRKTAEEALRRTEAFQREVQRLSRTGGWRYDPATGLVESSPEIQRAYAIGADEDITSPETWFARLHPEDRESVRGTFERCVLEKTNYQADYRIVRPDGSIRYQHTIAHPVVDGSGALLEFIGASMDVTEHWLAKIEVERASEALRELQTKLSLAARIATVGELSASIAHEINQPLAAVVANAQACLRWLSAVPPNIERAFEAADRIVRDAKDASEVVQHVRSLFRRAAVDQVRLDVNELIVQVLSVVEAERTRRQVRLAVDLEPHLPPVLGDRVQLQQLMLNLLLNGLEAMDSVADRPKTLFVRSLRQGNEAALVEVRDTGVGLPDPDRIFEPFFTTKECGLGMGLSICRSIAEAHGGRLWAASGAGPGTTFCFALPLQPVVST
jgi:PAS domain S-box-containing protein